MGIDKEPAISGLDSSSPAPLAVVTGASSGIGASIAAQLAGRGYRLLLVARRLDVLQQLANTLEPRMTAIDSGEPRHMVACVDMARPDDIESAIGEALGPGASPDVLINCAGAGFYRPFLECSGNDAARLMNVNYFAAAEMVRVLLPRMLLRRKGHIINVASICAKMGPWGHSAYAPCKAALVSLTQTLAAEHARSGVRFSYVNPGIVDTAFFANPDVAPLWRRVRGRAISADVVARRIVRLIDRPKLEVCIPRHYRFIAAIAALHAGLAHRLVAWQSSPRAPRPLPLALRDDHPVAPVIKPAAPPM